MVARAICSLARATCYLVRAMSTIARAMIGMLTGVVVQTIKDITE